MKLLCLLSCLWFSPDVEQLSSPDYATREAAHKRLVAAGWAASPATEISGDTLEASERLARIRGKRERLDKQLAVLAVANPEAVPDALLLPLGQAISDALEPLWESPLPTIGLQRLDWDWMQRTPFRKGSVAADIRYSIHESYKLNGVLWSRWLSNRVCSRSMIPSLLPRASR